MIDPNSADTLSMFIRWLLYIAAGTGIVLWLLWRAKQQSDWPRTERREGERDE